MLNSELITLLTLQEHPMLQGFLAYASQVFSITTIAHFERGSQILAQGLPMDIYFLRDHISSIAYILYFDDSLAC